MVDATWLVVVPLDPLGHAHKHGTGIVDCVVVLNGGGVGGGDLTFFVSLLWCSIVEARDSVRF